MKITIQCKDISNSLAPKYNLNVPWNSSDLFLKHKNTVLRAGRGSTQGSKCTVNEHPQNALMLPHPGCANGNDEELTFCICNTSEHFYRSCHSVISKLVHILGELPDDIFKIPKPSLDARPI